MSKQAKLLSHLQAGAELTAKQISGTFGLKNPGRAVHLLRTQGFCVYSNPTTLSNGATVVKYRIGTPSKRIVALANAIGGAEMFTRK